MATFRALFAPPVIRSMLDWDLLMRIRPAVDTVVITSLDQVGGLFTTWYLDEGGRGEVAFEVASRAPLTVREAVRRMDELDPERVEHLRNGPTEAGMRALLVPLYRVGEGRYLILDGNHRLVSACQAHRQVRVLGLAIQGPVDPRVLPDLAFWTKETPSP